MRRERERERAWLRSAALGVLVVAGAAAIGTWFLLSSNADSPRAIEAQRLTLEATDAPVPSGASEEPAEAADQVTPDPGTTEGIREILGEVWEEDMAKPRFEGSTGPFQVGKPLLGAPRLVSPA